MGLADAYKKLGSANVAIAEREMKRETGMGMADALSEGLGFLSKAAGDASTDAANLEAGETLLEGTGYSIDDTRVDASGKNHWYNPFTWGGYQVKNTEGDIMSGRGAKESVRNLGVLSRSAAAAGTENEAILKKWADWNQFGTTSTPNQPPPKAQPKVKPKPVIKKQTSTVVHMTDEDYDIMNRGSVKRGRKSSRALPNVELQTKKKIGMQYRKGNLGELPDWKKIFSKIFPFQRTKEKVGGESWRDRFHRQMTWEEK